MRRRDAIAGLGSLGVIVGAGALAVGGRSLLEGSPEESVEPMEIETIDVPGSESGTVTVPDPELVTVLDFFATWCTTCESEMPTLAEAESTTGEDVRFLSVTNEPVGHSLEVEDVAATWEEWGGAWLVGLDPNVELAERHDGLQYPTTVVLDGDGREHYYNQGRKDLEELLAGIEAARTA